MKILHYKKEDYNITDAAQLCLNLEQSLGIYLMNHSAQNPNYVNGYLNTFESGDVEVYLYTIEDEIVNHHYFLQVSDKINLEELSDLFFLNLGFLKIK